MTDLEHDDELISSPQAAFDALRNVTPETPCPYLPGRQSRSEVYSAEQLDGELYECLLALGFRRSGSLIYRPRCRRCRECRQLRIMVDEFSPSRGMRRVHRLNVDVNVAMSKPTPTDEKFAVFKDYLDAQHDDTMSRSYDAFHDFLYDSPLETWEFEYRLGKRLIGVSIADQCSNGLSSVYMYFDPAFGSRSLGTLSVLHETEYCRTRGLSYYYLGFYVAGSRTMAYKARFKPNQVLVGNDRWVAFRE
ncbi:MAG: arginyltransferase [Phycisphaerales bacterium]|nr:MAG: arginyltransferase [Phycisphaerales bacterium]